MTTQTTIAAVLTAEELDLLKGASVQIHHDAVDMGSNNLHMWAGKHGTLQGINPFGAALIAVGNATKVFDLDQFSVTAAPGAAPADAPKEAPKASADDHAPTVRLVNQPPLYAINSPTNPRRRRGLDVDSLRTLADSITTHGLAQPILVRPLPASRVEDTSHMDPRPAYEVVAGERRWRAAQLAELPTMPMLVRDLTDGAVLEIQLVENIEREDMDPMEEAEGFALLREKLGYTVEQIAAKMGKGRGPSYVRKRMKLLDLTPESREAMYDGTLQLSTGLLVARHPAEKQAEAIKFIAKMATKGADGSVVHAPFRDVSLALYRKFATILKTAAFDINDPGLVFNAGPCSTCSKRTRAHEDLFAESTDAGEDSCLDSTCWAEKKTAHMQRVRADAQARGLTVLEEAEALKVAPSPWSSFRPGYVSLDATAYTEVGDDGQEREVTYADALRAQGRKAAKPVVLINPHTSKAEELLPDDVATKLLPQKMQDEQAARVQRTNQARERVDTRSPEEKAWDRSAVMRAAVIRLFDAVRQRERTVEELRLVALQTIAHRDGDNLEILEVYMGWGDAHDADDPTEYLCEKIAALDADQLAQVITMAAIEAALTTWNGHYGDDEDALAYLQAYGIDVLAVQAKVDEDLERQNQPAGAAVDTAADEGDGDGGAGGVELDEEDGQEGGEA